jgi:hypothetical protein
VLAVSCALTKKIPFFNVPMFVVEGAAAETIVPRRELYPALA